MAQRKLDRLSTYTAGIGVPVLRMDDRPLVSLPSVENRSRYAWTYWSGMVRNLSGPHALRAETAVPQSAAVRVTDKVRADWRRLFDSTGESVRTDVPIPYLYNQSVGTLLYTRVLASMGINFRHLLHVQHETKHWSSVREWITTDDQELHVSVRGAWRLGDGKALVGLRSAIHRARRDGGALLGTVNDRFIIRNVPEEQLNALTTGRSLLRNLAELRRKEPALDATAPESVVCSISLEKNLGKRFGRVSGDFNPVHTTALAARLFGIKRPFLQGLGLRNAVVRQLALHDRPLTRFSMSFASPAFLGQTLRLVMQGDAFEVVDARNQVVAFGDGSAEP